jgi:hypothetical protein
MRDVIDWCWIIYNGPAQDLAILAGHRLGLVLPARIFRRECKRAATEAMYYSGYRLGEGSQEWSAGTWTSWLKNRAIAVDGYLPGIGEDNPPPIMTCVLHIGFLSVEETAAQLALLRASPDVRRAVVDRRDRQLSARYLSTARSRISSTVQYIRPIDRVAARVGPVP